jgi:creatinine amidohydrolase
MKGLSGSQLMISLSLALIMSNQAVAQSVNEKIPWRYEELNAIQFKEALKASQETCIIPIGVLEKHGPHLPLGTDLINVRELALRAVEQEYSIIFPAYYFSQIFEAKHQPGTIAYSHETIWNVLQETCDELARNGIKKIIIVNGHGGNNSLLPYFRQAQLAARKN